MRRLFRLAVLCAVCALMAATPGLGGTSSVAPIPVSTALNRLTHGQAQRATLVLSPVTPTLHLTAGSKRYVAQVTQDMARDIVSAARRGHVPLTVERPSSASPITTTLHTGGGGFDLTTWMQTWGSMLLLAALVVVSGMALRVAGAGRFKQRLRPVRSATTFADIAGIDEIRDDVAEIADVLRNPRPYKALGAHLPKGIILHGPPGTGKTLLAKAVAGEAGVKFFSASGSEFVEMYAGLGSRRVRALFAAARKAAPAVVYIDEIDAVGARRNGHASSGEREHTLDQLLAEMDGFHTDPDRPVVVLASTNRLSDLDPALVRSGRFDRKIPVGYPDRRARREILEVHLANRPVAADTDRVAAMTAGLAGADLAALCNEAAFEAARAGMREIDLDHFRRALLRLAGGPEHRSKVMTDAERRLVAYHEMGHALVAHMSASYPPVERVTVIPQGHALGVTIWLPDEDKFLATRTELMEELAVALGGRAAEEIVFGDVTSGAASDLESAARVARRMAGELAMAAPTTHEAILVGLPAPRDERSAEDVELAAQRLVGQAFLEAVRVLTEHRDLLELGAQELLEREAMDRDEILRLLGPRPGTGRLAPLDAV
ncbi:MAG: AAA family ATPase [Thermoleophilia bacterium]